MISVQDLESFPCEKFIAWAEARSGTRTDEDYRRCTQFFFDNDEGLLEIFKEALSYGIAAYLNKHDSIRFLRRATCIERPSIIRYDVGKDFFAEHSDNWNAASSTRQLAAILYLNNVAEGGETVFQGVDVSEGIFPKAGRLLLFPAFWTHPHRSEPSISNEKWCIVTWLKFPDEGAALYGPDLPLNWHS